MDAALATRAGGVDDAGAAWIRLHIVDIVTLVLGSTLALRFWFLFFGVGDRRLIAIFAVLTACEVTKRLATAYRERQRPRLFFAERRSDLIAGIALGTAPWPIALPITAATPIWTIAQPLAEAGWIGPIVVGVALAASVRRVLFS
jgi:hypothetical protein